MSPLSSELEYLSCRDWRLAHLIDFVGPIVRHNDETAFSFLARSIVGQMLSLKAAATIESRLLELCNGTLSFASVAECTVDEIRAIGISSRKASYLLDLATASTEEDLATLSSLSDDGVREALERHRGIGRWTSNMLEYIILGFLMTKERSGYDLKRCMTQTTSYFFDASFGSIYPALKRLTQKGLVTFREDVDGGKFKKVYRITDSGRTAFMTEKRGRSTSELVSRLSIVSSCVITESGEASLPDAAMVSTTPTPSASLGVREPPKKSQKSPG